MDTFKNLERHSRNCESFVKQTMPCTGPINLTNWSQILGQEEIEAYGRAYLCVLTKYFYVDKTYDSDSDAFYEYFDFGNFKLSYNECISNPKYSEVIQYGKGNKTFDANFFGHLKKCINDRIAEINRPDKTFLKIENSWRDHVYSSLIIFRDRAISTFQ